MKNIYTGVLSFAFIISGYFIFASNHFLHTEGRHLGGADAIGSEEDANARYNYEMMLLRDPATGRVPDHIREKELAFAATLPNDWHSANTFAKTTSLVWQPRGPWNVGGRTRAFAIDVSNENNLVAGSASGGMWRSTDQGLSWVPTSTSLQYKSVSCLAQDTRSGHTNVWYYGTGEATGASASSGGAYYLGNGIYKSIDSGVTWTVLASTTSNNVTSFTVWGQVVWNVVTNAADTVNDVVYAATYGGIYKTTNGGTSWTLVKGTFSSSISYFTDIAVSKTGIIYATLSSDGPQKGLYRSTDGVTFTNITPANFPVNYNRVKIGISPMDETQVYFLGNTPGYGIPDTNFLGDVEWNSLWKYKYLSGDGSDTGGYWQDFSANLPSGGGVFDKYSCQGSYDMVIKVKPNDTNTVFLGGTNLYRSTSGFSDTTHTTFIGGYQKGASLPVVNEYANHHPDQHELVFFPSDANKMISANDGGIFVNGDNTAATISWTPLNNGYITTMFYSCAIDHAATNDIIVGGAQDNGSWYTNSSTLTSPWVSTMGGDGSYCAIADNAAAYYFSLQNAKMIRAKLNASGGIDSFTRIDPIGGKGYQFVNPFVIDPNNNNIMYMAGGKYLWRNDDLSGIPYAANWDSISTNWVRYADSVPVAGATITALAVSKTPANRVYYGTSSQKVYRVDNANVGTPTPVNITSTTAGVAFPAGANVSCIAVDPNNADNVMVVFSNYNVYSLYYSSDGGTTWAKAAGNLEQFVSGTGNGPSCRWASIIPVNGGTVYLVGTSIGLYASTHLNGTATVWVQQGTNSIGADVVDMMDYRSTDGLVTVATHSAGMFSTHISDTSDITGVPIIAANQDDLRFINYPNPFSSVNNIRFSLNEKTRVSLNVYNEAGVLISNLINEQMDAGEKSYSFSAKQLAPGMYYFTLQAGTLRETRRALLLK